MNNKQDLSDTDPSHSHIVVLHSSESLPWKGIFFEQRYHPAGEYVYPAFSGHMICLHQGPPSFLEHIGNGQHHTGMRTPGSIQIVPAGTACTWRHPAGARFTNLLLSTEVMKQVATDLNQRRIEILDHFSIQDPRIAHISLALLAELAAGGPSGRLYGEGLATALAAHLISSYSSTPRPLPETIRGLPAPLLRRVISVIEDRLPEDLGLAELAQEAGLSQSHFASLFRKTTGLSPHQYIVRRRVERAQSLLQSTTLSIDEIASTVGFYDQSHLTRQMRQILGVTPKYVREHPL
ncbi:MAG: helix-turn-helix transcriptional regulator [Chloroflexi bacterium]|nr:helix-turn-helix transcriptional regulator [Chloroflexota bacterium]